MIKTIIIDDEVPAANRLAELLQRHCRQTIVLAGSFHSVETGLQAIKNLRPQLVFLDVQIHDQTGFDLLKLLPEKTFDVIFVTAYEKYAVDAFKFSAVDYLLKPVGPDDLVQAVAKLFPKKPADQLARRFDTLLDNMEQLKQYTPPKKIVVPTVSGFELLPIIDILRCESDINYTTIYLRDKQKLKVAKTLKEFDDMLTAYNFFRVHNSHLVNLAYIKSYHRGKGGAVTLIDGTEIEVSTRRREDFLKKITDQ